jgi:hypothetical protein
MGYKAYGGDKMSSPLSQVSKKGEKDEDRQLTYNEMMEKYADDLDASQASQVQAFTDSIQKSHQSKFDERNKHVADSLQSANDADYNAALQKQIDDLQKKKK